MPVCMYVHIYVCISSLYSHVTVHIFDMLVERCGCHILNMTHTAIILHGHINPIFVQMCQNMTNCNCHVCANNDYAPQMPHMSRLSHVHMRQPFSIYTS